MPGAFWKNPFLARTTWREEIFLDRELEPGQKKNKCRIPYVLLSAFITREGNSIAVSFSTLGMMTLCPYASSLLTFHSLSTMLRIKIQTPSPFSPFQSPIAFPSDSSLLCVRSLKLLFHLPFSLTVLFPSRAGLPLLFRSPYRGSQLSRALGLRAASPRGRATPSHRSQKAPAWGSRRRYDDRNRARARTHSLTHTLTHVQGKRRARTDLKCARERAPNTRSEEGTCAGHEMGERGEGRRCPSPPPTSKFCTHNSSFPMTSQLSYCRCVGLDQAALTRCGG